MVVIGKLRRISWAERGLLAEAVLCLGLARLLIVGVPFRRLAPLLGKPRAETAATALSGREPFLRRVTWALRATGRRLPWRCMCLEQAVAARLMLRRRGIPYTLYLAYQAAVLTAGSVAVDRTRLGRLPVSSTSFLVGKLVGSLLPLWGEIVVTAPLVVWFWDVVTHSATTGAWVVAYLLALVLGWGAWGALWASGGPSARAALTATKVSLAIVLVGLPLLAWFLASGVPGAPPIVVLQPVLMLHPAGGLLLVGNVVDHTSQARWGLYAATAVPALALLLAWLGLKRRLR